MEAMLNTQLALWKKESIVQRCFTVGYSTWRASEDAGSLVNTIQVISLQVGKNYKSTVSVLSGMM